MKTNIQEELTTIIQAISSNIKIEDMFLFGSWARRSKALTLENTIAKRGYVSMETKTVLEWFYSPFAVHARYPLEIEITSTNEA